MKKAFAAGVDLPKDDPGLNLLHESMVREFDNGRVTSIEWEELAARVQELVVEKA